MFEFSGECEVVDLALFEGMLGLQLACDHGLPEPVPVTITASATEPPSGVGAGDILTLEAGIYFLQGGDQPGPDFYLEANYRSYELSDAQGLVLAGAFGLGDDDYDYGVLSLHLAACGPYEFGDDAQGYWQVSAGDQTIGVADGFVETITSGDQTYRIENFRSWLTCCHGHDIGFSVLRQ
ncbi:MAG: hypothetical protein HC927_06050 [Deltaproteobacteria bacterium]|nr:hypothetical protein [Deltaproteobacteria bacterium]